VLRTPERKEKNMRVLVTWGSERGGTAGIATTLSEALRRNGIEVLAMPACDVSSLRGIDAVIVGGALYANRWHREARRFVARNQDALRRVPVWFFSSGPLDATADAAEIPPTSQVAALMRRIGARGHHTFGGRLAPDAQGFPARAMAKKMSGDWRNPTRIRAWADELAAMLPNAQPGIAVEPEGRSLSRLFAYVLMAALLGVIARVAVAPFHVTGLAIGLHAIAAAAITVAVARRYFRPGDARDPLPSGLVFAAGFALFDALTVAVCTDDVATAVGAAAIVISAAIALLAVWATGGLMSTMPWPHAQH
jgi:menaquinone-dependent protoporphyrinogen oxidase